MTAPPLVRQNGPAIRAIRRLNGMTPAALAERSGFENEQSLRNIESEHRSASEEALERIAAALEVEVAAIRRMPLSWSFRNVLTAVPEPARQAAS